MKQFYLFFWLLLSGFVNAQVINFPDANFKNKLLQPNTNFDEDFDEVVLDPNGDGEIEVAEAERVYFLDVSNAGISDLTGISYFTGLKQLYCNNNSLTDLTIDNAIRLQFLKADHNNIASVTIDLDDGYVEGFDLSYNNLTSFTVQSGIYWEDFNLNNNQLTNLTIDHATFQNLNINNNNLTSIQILGNTGVYNYAVFSNNQFTELDLSQLGGFDVDDSHLLLQGNDDLVRVTFSNNFHNPAHVYYSSSNSTSLNLENFRSLSDCMGRVAVLSITNSPNLDEIILKNGFIHHDVTCDEGPFQFQIPGLNLSIANCPNLSYLCVDEGEQDFFQTRINQLGLENQVAINTECNLGMPEMVSNDLFTISPVPAKSILHINPKDNLQIENIEIYNNLGQIVQNEIGSQQSIDVSRLSRGSYYLKIYAGESISVKQFLKD